MDFQTLKEVRKPKPYTPIEQVQLGTDTHSGWGVPAEVPKGALKELETKYASLIQEKYDLQVKLRKVLSASAEVEGKGQERNRQYKGMTGRLPNSSKKLKPFVDPQIWEDLEEPVKEALRGLYGLCKGDGLKTRCPTIAGMLHLVGDGELVKLLKTKHLSECKFSKQLIPFKVRTIFRIVFAH
jgi:hypothetical protein